MSAQPRIWTADEEDLMWRQSMGDFSMHWLEKSLHGSREAIIDRMKELGLKPVIQKKRGIRWTEKGVRTRDFEPEPEPEPIPAADEPILNYAPSVGGGDEKFARLLRAAHGDRTYEALELPMKKARR